MPIFTPLYCTEYIYFLNRKAIFDWKKYLHGLLLSRRCTRYRVNNLSQAAVVLSRKHSSRRSLSLYIYTYLSREKYFSEKKKYFLSCNIENSLYRYSAHTTVHLATPPRHIYTHTYPQQQQQQPVESKTGAALQPHSLRSSLSLSLSLLSRATETEPYLIHSLARSRGQWLLPLARARFKEKPGCCWGYF